MVIELNKSNLQVEAEKALKVYYDNQVVGDFYVDLLHDYRLLLNKNNLNAI